MPVQPIRTQYTNNTSVAIADVSTVTSTIDVSGADPFLYDLNLQTFITHTFAGDLDITLTSPSGTVVTLTTDNGAGNDNVFNGTIWDDSANPGGQVPYTTNSGLVTDHPYANNVVASSLVPEEAFGAFIGENPNGTWTITVSDDLESDTGSLNSWTLDLATLPGAPPTRSSTFNTSTPVAIPTGPAVVTSTLDVSGVGHNLLDVNLQTFITHTFPGDLDITLTSPSGTVVTLTTDNGGTNDNVFNGTIWDDSANPGGQVPYTTNSGLVTDHPYANNVVASSLVPEEAFGAFIGENPNGTWTITISDDAGNDGGALNSWSLDFTVVDDPPVVANPIADQNSPSNAEWVFQVPATAFNDVDGDVLTHTASLDNGNPLPDWLTFNGANRTFTGAPPLDFVGQLALKVTASDAASSVSDTFILGIVDTPSPVINLSEGDDNFGGTGLGEIINGLGGNDTVQAGAGNDRVNGNDGNDKIDGGSGANVLHGNDGNDFVTAFGNFNQGFGDGDNDLVFFVGNQNQLYGGSGNDWHGVSGNNNALAGGDGHDFLGATGDGNTLNGQDGVDFLFAIGNSNSLYGETGIDWLGVSGNANSLFGGAGVDWLGASGDNNLLDGGAGNDTLVALPGGHHGDTFVFHAGYGLDEISGFAHHGAGGTDVVDLKDFGFANFAAVQALIADSGGNAVLTINAATVLTIDGVLKAQLQASDFLLA